MTETSERPRRGERITVTITGTLRFNVEEGDDTMFLTLDDERETTLPFPIELKVERVPWSVGDKFMMRDDRRNTGEILAIDGGMLWAKTADDGHTTLEVADIVPIPAEPTKQPAF